MDISGFGKVAACLAAVILLGAAPAGADTLLSGLTGTWKGRGWAKTDLGAPKEAILCRIKNSAGAKPNRLKISGRCAVANRTFTMNGEIIAAPGSNRVSGTWKDPRNGKRADISGQISGNRIRFTFEAEETSTRQTLTHSAQWQLNSAQLSISASVKPPSGGKSVTMSSVQLQRQ